MAKPHIYIEGEEGTKFEIWLNQHKDQIVLGVNAIFMLISVATLIMLAKVIKYTKPDGVVS